jgi:hypothetical protein
MNTQMGEISALQTFSIKTMSAIPGMVIELTNNFKGIEVLNKSTLSMILVSQV